MKPYDGGGWRGVSRIDSPDDLRAAYDESGEMLMHLQQAVDPYDSFARALTIGPETMVMKFRPDEPMHDRYEVAFCVATGRAMRAHADPKPWFSIADDPDRDEADRMAATRPWPTSTSRSIAIAISAPRRCRTSTNWCTTGCAPTTSTTCWSRPSAPPTRRTSTTRFLGHLRGLLDLWRTDHATAGT